MNDNKKEEIISAIIKMRKLLSELGITCSRSYEITVFCDLFTMADTRNISLSGKACGCLRRVKDDDYGNPVISVSIDESFDSKEAIFAILKEKGIPLPEKWEKTTRVSGNEGYTVYECEVEHNGNTHLLSYDKKGLGPKCKVVENKYYTVACDISSDIS